MPEENNDLLEQREPLRDVVIVGGGPAGLSAALILGRCRRSVLVCDMSTPRNARAREIHGFLTRDAIPPFELRRAARADLARYPGVELRKDRVLEVGRPRSREGGGFRVILESGLAVRARRLLIATGLVDIVPEIQGLDELYGSSVHHCPYCDAWEWRDRAIAVYGRGKHAAEAAETAISFRQWTPDVVLLTDGPAGEIARKERALLERHEIPVRTDPVFRLEGEDGLLRRIVFVGGKTLARDALFFAADYRQQSDLAESLGCKVAKDGSISTDEKEKACKDGVYVAGDASRRVKFAIVAAAEGALAAQDINKSLLDEDLFD